MTTTTITPPSRRRLRDPRDASAAETVSQTLTMA